MILILALDAPIRSLQELHGGTRGTSRRMASFSSKNTRFSKTCFRSLFPDSSRDALGVHTTSRPARALSAQRRGRPVVMHRTEQTAPRRKRSLFLLLTRYVYASSIILLLSRSQLHWCFKFFPNTAAASRLVSYDAVAAAASEASNSSFPGSGFRRIAVVPFSFCSRWRCQAMQWQTKPDQTRETKMKGKLKKTSRLSIRAQDGCV